MVSYRYKSAFCAREREALFGMGEIRLGKYRHLKGNEYEVVAVGKHSETLEDYVIYRALYGEGGYWVRPLSMFFEDVERDGKVFPRFEYIGE